MPRIRDDLLNSILYLYPSESDAKNGLNDGGTGFLVAVPAEKYPPHSAIYAVTNSHVITHSEKHGCKVIRFNTRDGNTEILKTENKQWIHHPEHDDIAIMRLPFKEGIKSYYIHANAFITQDDIHEHNIGPGDDTYMIGRFSGHSGKKNNLPCVRFGNISMMPYESIFQRERMHEQECFLIETRSLTGSSGSPAFLYIPPTADRPEYDILKTFQKSRQWFLGINCGHIHLSEKIYKNITGQNTQKACKNFTVPINSGQAMVIPAWRIYNMLYSDDFINDRESAPSSP